MESFICIGRQTIGSRPILKHTFNVAMHVMDKIFLVYFKHNSLLIAPIPTVVQLNVLTK